MFPLLPIPGGHLDLVRGRATVDDVVAALTPIEIAVLSVLVEASPEAVSEDTLLDRAWGYKTRKTRTVSMGISRLRAKIERDPRAPQVVQTVRGIGYRFRAAVTPAPTPTPAPAPTPVPTGRADEARRAAEAAARGARVVELVGPAGMGASTLARHLAGPGARWVTCRDVVGSTQLLRRLCDAFEVEGPDGLALLPAALGLAGSWVLDGAESLDDEAVALLREVTREATGPLYLTTRAPTGLGARVVLAPLGDADALQLLQEARRDIGLPPVEAEVARPVLEQVGGFPLALVLVAPLVELAPGDSALLALADDSDSELGRLGRGLRDTLRLLPDHERELLGLASAFAVPPPLLRLAEATELPQAMLLRALHSLRERGLVRMEHGVVEVPSLVCIVASTASGRARHAAWVAQRHSDPVSLRLVRHELEAALPHASADVLPFVLLRHLIVLYSYGPADRIDDDALAWLPSVPDRGRRAVLRGATLQASGERRAAFEAYGEALELLPATDPTFTGWAWLMRSVIATWLRDLDEAHATIEPLLSLREGIDDLALWASMTTNAASLLAADEPARADALWRELDAVLPEVPSIALAAAFHQLGGAAASSSRVRWVEKQLQGVGEAVLGRRRWVLHGLRLGRAWVRVGEHERGLELLQRFSAEAIAIHAVEADNILTVAAASALHAPEVARAALALLSDPEREYVGLLHWVLDEAPGPPPTDDPALAALFADVRARRPVEVVRGALGLSRALVAMQRLAGIEEAP